MTNLIKEQPVTTATKLLTSEKAATGDLHLDASSDAWTLLKNACNDYPTVDYRNSTKKEIDDIKKHKESSPLRYYLDGDVEGSERKLKRAGIVGRDIKSRQIVTLDLDSSNHSQDDLQKRLEGYEYILTPTPSYEAGARRWRVIMPLDLPCSTKDYEGIVCEVISMLELVLQTKDKDGKVVGDVDKTCMDNDHLQGFPIAVTISDDEIVKPIHVEGKPLKTFDLINLALKKPKKDKKPPLALQGNVKGGLVVEGEFEQALKKYAERMRDKLDDGEYMGLWFNTLMSLRRTLVDGRIGKYEAPKVIRLLWADKPDLVKANIEWFNRQGDNIRMDKHIDEWIGLNESDLAYYERKTACESLNLDLNKKGEVLPTQQNYVRIIKEMFPQLYFDSYSQQIMNDGDIDIRRHDGEKIHYGANYYKSDTVLDKQERMSLMYFAQKRYGDFKLSRNELEDAFATVARENIRHRITTKLDVLKWDNVERLDEYLIKSVKAVDNAFTREVTRKTIVAMVMRAYRPGIKFELMPILVGQQGGGKSTAFRSLMYAVLGTADLYDDSLKMGDTSKDGMLSLNNAWVVEYSELRAVKGFTIEDMKALVTSDKDSYRKPYASDVTVNPRKCIMIGTTNETPQQLLNDSGGNRRWAIIECKQSQFDIKPTDVPLHESKDGLAYLHQVMAEAVHIAKSNFKTMDKGGTVDVRDRIDKLSESSMDYQADLNESLHTEADYIEMVSLFTNMTVPGNWDDMGLDEKQLHFVKVANNPNRHMDAWSDKVDAFTLQDVCKIACSDLETKVTPQNGAGQKVAAWLLENGFERDTDRTKRTRQRLYYRK